METLSRKSTIVQNEPEVLASVINETHMIDTQTSIDDNSSIQSYAPDIDNKDPNNSIDTESYQGSPLQIVKTRFFSKRLVDSRKKIIKSFLLTNFLYSIVIYTILLMFWGASAYTTKYYHKVKLLAVLQDDYIPDNNSQIISLTNSLGSIIEQSPGKWSIFNTTSFQERYDLTGGTEQINEKIIERIYHEHYWIAINIKPNTTMSLYDSLILGNNTTKMFNATDLFEVIYESGREPTNMASGFLPIIEAIEAEFQLFFATQYIPSLMNNITSTTNNLNFENLGSILQMNFYYNDYKPFYRRALISPIQVGLIFAIILSIFHFMLYSQINTYMAKFLKPRDYIFYRIGLTWFTFFFISLFYCSVSAIFKIDFTKAFGRGGFVVYWMTTWLFMLACGGANENVLSLIFLYGPQFLGFWILFFIIINASTTFFPFALNNVFYRIGYMLPMHNAADIYRVIFFDLTRIKMGRNYGVLIAWIVINTLLAPLIMWHVGETGKKRAQAAAAALEETEDTRK